MVAEGQKGGASTGLLVQWTSSSKVLEERRPTNSRPTKCTRTSRFPAAATQTLNKQTLTDHWRSKGCQTPLVVVLLRGGWRRYASIKASKTLSKDEAIETQRAICGHGPVLLHSSSAPKLKEPALKEPRRQPSRPVMPRQAEPIAFQGLPCASLPGQESFAPQRATRWSGSSPAALQTGLVEFLEWDRMDYGAKPSLGIERQHFGCTNKAPSKATSYVFRSIINVCFLEPWGLTYGILTMAQIVLLIF